ncbi:MAG TPA: HIT family protein [Gemmatimonadaceae bacterium]|nr:HIT family protein [Gemmatimonadaceae bacterium]
MKADDIDCRCMSVRCVFCEIVAGRAPASFIFRDDVISAFMSIQPTAAGECLIIPNEHIDHFTDISDEVAERIMTLAQRIGRRMRAVFPLERVGYLVHGYGVAHAHFMIVPQQGPHHLTSDRLARLADGRIVFDLSSIKIAERATLDEQARLLSQL